MLNNFLNLEAFSGKVMAFSVVFSWFIFKNPINNNTERSYHPWKEAVIPAVSLTTWNSFPHRPLILTRQDIWTNIFIISIAKKLGLNLLFFKICPDRVYSPKGKKESSSQVKLVFLLEDFSTFRFLSMCVRLKYAL